MDKFSELKAAAMAATPGPWVVTEKNNVEAPNQKRFRPVAYIFGNRAEHKRAADAAFIAAANPAVVLALLAELEAKDKRIAELERANKSQDDHINQQQDRIDSLEKKNAGLGRRLGDAEKRLATPVRLPDSDIYSALIMAHWCSGEEVNAWVKGINYAKQQIRAAGFKVETE